MNINRALLRANKLSRLIDESLDRPTELIDEFNDLIMRLKSAGVTELDEKVRCPENW